MPNQEKSQDFELIELLIREAGSNSEASPSTSTQQRGDFESFKARFQSYIDQIPSYLHSVGKEGFFPHFFLGSFSTLIDTEIAKKLDIEKIYFSFDGSKTLKVAVIRKGGITNQKSAIEKVSLFVISEFGKTDSKSKKFTYGELEEILGQSNLPAQNEHVRSTRDDLKVKLVKIVKATGEISVEVKDDKLDKNTSTVHKFKEIKKGLWSKPESDIAKLTNSDREEVKKSLDKVLKKVSKIHSEYKNSLIYAQATREAAHHGFVAGALVNFRYRHNLRVYLEQFAGRGYADIVLVPRGKDRSLNAIPVIIEMKAATKAELKEGKIGEKSGTTPIAALKQAEDYTKGFQPNVMRVLTTANDILCVGVNLDHPSPISDILDKSRNQKIIPLFNQILISIDGRNNGEITQEQLETRIQENIERIYHTFSGIGEKGDNHYFSRFLLGQSLLLNGVKALESDFEKHVFIYGENIPTETRSEGSGRGVPQRQAAKEAGKKLAESNKLDESHAVVTMVFVPENDERLVYVMNIVEADGRAEVISKGIPLDKLKREIGNRKIVELNLNFNVKEKSNFKKYFSIEVKKPILLEQYNNEKTDKFKGNFEKVPYPIELKETFDAVLKSRLASLQDQSQSIGKYQELFGKLGEGVLPFKVLIEKEAHTQAVFHGAFSHYSDVKLGESQENRALVLTEFQTGRGKRIDMLVHGIKFGGHGSNAKQHVPIGLELKGPREGKNTDALIKEANDQINKEYVKGVTYRTLTDGNEVDFMGVVFNKGANSANSLILGSKDEFTPVIVVHSSVHVIPTDQVAQSIDISKGEHLRGGQEVIQKLKNLGIQEENLRTLESATAEQDYRYWLQQHDVADIARIKYGYGIDEADTLFEIVGSPEHIVNQLQQFQNSVRGGEKRPLTLIVNLNNNHWVTLVISHQNGQYNGYYVDSLGSNVPDNIRQVLQLAQITVSDVSIAQQTDGHNCGLWALENARDINAALQEGRSNIPDEIRNRLQVQGRDEAYFIRTRENVSDRLSIDPQRIANLEAVLAKTQAPRKKFNLSSCVRPGGRSKRSVNPCLFSKGDVEKFSKGKVDENNVDKIIIDSEKFLTYVKSSQDEAKNAQLVEFVGGKSIEGDRKYLLDKVVGDQGYERYVQNERIKDLQGDVLQQNSGLTKNPKLKSRLMNAAGGIQLIRGIHGAIVSCKDGTATDCGLNLGGIGWSFASQPIENVMVKVTPKVVASAEKVVGKIIPGALGKQTKFAVQFVGVKFGSATAKGAAGAIAGVFDIIDIGISANNLVDCKNREGSDNPCGEKEIRDNMASIAFSGASFVSGVALTAASMPVVGIAVGFGLMVGYGIYSGVSNIVEYEKKYDTTHGENWSIFWRTLLFQSMAADVQHLVARKETVNGLAREVWKNLNANYTPSNVVAYGIGLGKVSDGTLRPDYATIMMNRTNANTRSLSRVIPNNIKGASRVCLPQITSQDYEKGIASSVPSAKYYCENAMVISHDRKVNMKQEDKTIVYDLQNVNRGKVVGSNIWNNNFLIYSGTEEIVGGNNVANRFVLINNPSFLGKIIGGRNSTNILDLSQLREDKVTGVIDYRFKPSNYGQLKVKINNRLLIDDYVSNSLFNYHYIARQSKVDEILCMGYSEHFIGNDDRKVIVDSGGGFDNNKKDVVENCKKVIISPYTTVKGGKSNYNFYVKTADYKGKGLYSGIDVDGTGTIIFPEIDLLGDCDRITYSTSSNTLSLKINFGQNNQFTLDIKNYVEQSSNKPHFALIDKNGSNIVPKIERSDSSTIEITSFELHSEHPLDSLNAVENHYKKILNNGKDYKVFSVIRGKTQGQDNNIVPHMAFGSSGDDVIHFEQGTMFARGGKGSDVYIIANDVNNKEVKIDNHSDDEKMDTLFMQEVKRDFSVQGCDLHLNYNNTSIQVKNYLEDLNYKHLIIMNKKGEIFIPDIQSMSCSSSGKGKLVPFLQATQTQNMFLLPKDFQDDHVVIDSRLEDIEKYKDKDDLLLTRESGIPFMIRIEGFYTDRSKCKNISYSLWNDNDLLPSPGLLENVDNVMEYKDKLRGDYERIVKEYNEGFSNPTNIIQHNQKLEKNVSTPVGQNEERIGIMVLKNITPDRVEVFSSGEDLIFCDKMSNHTIKIKNWDNSESYRISTLEFGLGLEPITIRKLDRFSLSQVGKIQALVDKASENYQNRSKHTPKVESDFKCLISVDGFERGNKNLIYQCLGFSSLQDQVSFTEDFCSLEQLSEFRDKLNSTQTSALSRTLQNNLLLNGYGQDVINQCSKLMMTEESNQQNRISSMVKNIQESVFLSQSKSKLDSASYLAGKKKRSSDLYSVFLENMHNELNREESSIRVITSGYETLDIENLPIREVVMNDYVNGKKSLRSTLYLRELVEQIDEDLSIKPVSMVIKDESDLLIKLSISTTGLQQDIITVRLKDALVNKWYKKLQIIFNNALMEIGDGLDLEPSLFVSNKRITLVRPQDIEERNKIIVSKRAGHHTYLHDKYDLIVTNAFNAEIEANELCVIRFKDFYREPKMKTLSIRFADKEVLLNNEIGKIYNSESAEKLNYVSSVLMLQKSPLPLEANVNITDVEILKQKLDLYRQLLPAVQNRDLNKIKDLMSEGADIDIKDNDGRTPESKLYDTRSDIIRKVFMQARLDRELLLTVKSEKDLKTMNDLIAKDIEDRTHGGFYYAWSGNLGAVKLLVERDVSVNATDKYGCTMLHWAELKGHSNVAKLLVDKGTNVNAKDIFGRTPAYLASYGGYLDALGYLIDNGTNTNTKDSNGKTLLDIAKDKEHSNIVGYSEERLKKVGGKTVQRRRRHLHRGYSSHRLSHESLAIGQSDQPGVGVSSSTKPSSWINGLFGWVKISIGGLLNPKPEGISSTKHSISQVDAQIDVNSTIILLDVLVRKVTGRKYIYTADQSISPLEAQGYVLNVTKEFEKVVEQAGLKSGVSMHRLNIDFVEIQKEITGKIMSGDFDEISGILSSYIEKACPGREAGCPGKLSPKKFDKFMTIFDNKLDIALNQSIQQILHGGDGKLEVRGAEKQQMSLGPQSYLSNASVQGHLTRNKVKLIS